MHASSAAWARISSSKSSSARAARPPSPPRPGWRHRSTCGEADAHGVGGPLLRLLTGGRDPAIQGRLDLVGVVPDDHDLLARCRPRLRDASTCSSIGRPASGWSTFGRRDRMRVPCPAARTTAAAARHDGDGSSAEASATISISTSAPFGSARHGDRGAGRERRRRGDSAYTSLTAAKSAMSTRKIVVFTHVIEAGARLGEHRGEVAQRSVRLGGHALDELAARRIEADLPGGEDQRRPRGSPGCTGPIAAGAASVWTCARAVMPPPSSIGLRSSHARRRGASILRRFADLHDLRRPRRAAWSR